MSMDVFDPAEHKIVAIDRNGRHLHVTLLELAMDMSAVDFAPFFARLRELEDMARENATAPAVDLSPMLEGLANLAKRVAALENDVVQNLHKLPDRVPAAPEIDTESIVQAVLAHVPPPAPAAPRFDPAPLHAELDALKTRLAAIEAMATEQDRLIHAIANAMGALADAAERKLSAA